MSFKNRTVIVGEGDDCRTLHVRGKRIGDALWNATLAVVDRTSSGSVSWEPTPASLRELAAHLTDLADWIECQDNNPKPPEKPSLKLVRGRN